MNIKRLMLSAASVVISSTVYAAAYTVPPVNESLIGDLQYTTTEGNNESVVSIQKRYNVGYNAMENVNPNQDLSKNFQPGTRLIIPTQHLLPNQPRSGIVVNLPEMRMYYYPAGTNEVLTYPIGIGKIGKTIPITKTAITKKVENPVWVPPADIREFNLKQGIVLPSIMPAGPENPLGPYAIYMRVPTYLIHSTIFPESVGKRASFGCLRMYESDIKEFFPSVKGGIDVTIINSPVKVGWQDQRLYIEAYKPLEEHSNESDATLPGMVHLVNDNTKSTDTLVDWQQIAFLSKHRDGIPHEIGMKLN